MNYLRIYNQLIQNRQLNPFDGYTEKHHIIPKSHGGNDSKENLVRLSAREHFIAHWLLWRIHRDMSMAYAFHSMCRNNQGKRYKNSKGFEEARKVFGTYQKGKQHALGLLHSEETKKKISESSKGRMHMKGKKLSDETRKKLSDAVMGRSKPIAICPHCDKSGRDSLMTRYHFDNCKFKLLM